LQTDNGRRMPFPALRNIGCRGRGGSVLMVVLWIVGILAILVGFFAFDAHLEARLTSHMRKRAKAEALARSGIEIAKMLMKKSQDVRGVDSESEEAKKDRWFSHAWLLSKGLAIGRGTLVEQLGDGTVSVEIVPEPARRNINNLGSTDIQREEALERILEVGGIPEEMFPRLVESFLDWIDGDGEPRRDGAETDDYYARLDPPYRAKNGPLDTVGELLLVRGFNRAVLYGGTLEPAREGEEPVSVSGIEDMLTTYGDGKVNVNAASKRVLMTLPEIDDVTASAIIEEREGWYDESGRRKDSSFKSVDDFMARVPGVPPAVREMVTTESAIYRVTSVGQIGGVMYRIWCVLERSAGGATVLRWREGE